MKICYCDVNNQFARYLHSINHPLVKELTAFRNHERTAFYYWRVTERRLTYSDDYVGMATQVSLGEFIGNISSLRSNPELIIPLMLFGKKYVDRHFGYNFWKWSLSKFKSQKDIFTREEKNKIFEMMKSEFAIK